MKLEIGKEYNIVDTFGMVSSKRKYLGRGYQYETSDGETYYKRSDQKYYVFEKLDSEHHSSYRFSLATPIFSEELEFSGSFQNVRYGNDLNHLFVDFKQTYFELGDQYSIKPEEFPKPYSNEFANSGHKGYLLGPITSGLKIG